MKKNRILWMMAGVATLVVTGCQREQLRPSPLYNPETKEVTAEFVLNVTAADQDAQTKMSADAVQKNKNFRGIQDVHIFAYSTGTESGTPYVLKTSGWTDATVKEFSLGTVFRTGQINNGPTVITLPGEDGILGTDDDVVTTDPNTIGNEENSSNRVLQLSIPVGTDAILFYGKASGPSSTPSIAERKLYGSTVINYDVNPQKTDVEIYRRIGNDDDVEDYNATARLMVFVINRIMLSDVAAGGEQDGFTGLPALSWKDLGARYEYTNPGEYGNRFDLSGTVEDLDPLEEILGKTYSRFTYIKDNEFRAGASAAIKYMMKNMYEVIHPVATATPTESREANAKRLAKEIEKRMTHYFKNNWEYRPIINTAKTNPEDAIYDIVVTELHLMEDDEWTEQFDGAKDLNKYPYEDFNIPEGAAQLEYNSGTGKFAYLNPNQALVTPNVTFDPKKYVYAPELIYYVNSPVRVNDTTWDPDDPDFYPNGTKPWANDTKWGSGWVKDGKVSSATRAVAVRDNINYAVALLKTSVAATGATLPDNRNAMSDGKEANQNIPVNKIMLTGILVGGVNPRYDWQFLRRYSTYDSTDPKQTMDFTKFDGVIYDDQIVDSTIPTPAGHETYTLVYDNYNSSVADNAQNNVYIALEFENQSVDFWGRDNLIPNGSKFYLAAQLVNSVERQGNIIWPSDHQVPPIWGVDPNDTAEAMAEAGAKPGESKKIPRIFIQDFMTNAVFTLGPNALQKAYYTMPDLRSSNMSLGLSVDIQWETGYNFADLVF